MPGILTSQTLKGFGEVKEGAELKLKRRYDANRLVAVLIITLLSVVWTWGAQVTAESKSWPDAFPKKGADAPMGRIF